MAVTCHVRVVELSGETMFHLGNSYFDSLRCFRQFWHGSLQVLRDQSIIDQTVTIDEVGTHGQVMCFIGLQNLHLSQPRGPRMYSDIQAGDFLPGDILKISILSESGQAYNLERDVRRWAAIAGQAFHFPPSRETKSLAALTRTELNNLEIHVILRFKGNV